MLTREQIAARAARELAGAATVFLEEGLPRLIAGQLPEGATLYEPGEPGATVDVAVVSGSELASNGEFVGKPLAIGAKKLIVLLEQVQAADGAPAVRAACQAPATGRVHQVITPLAVFDVHPEGLVMREVAPGVSALDVQQQSGTPLLAADDLKVIQL